MVNKPMLKKHLMCSIDLVAAVQRVWCPGLSSGRDKDVDRLGWLTNKAFAALGMFS